MSSTLARKRASAQTSTRKSCLAGRASERERVRERDGTTRTTCTRRKRKAPSLLRIHSQTQQLNSSQPPLPPSPSPSPSPPPQYRTHVFRLFGPLGQCVSPFREENCSGLLDCPLLNTKPHSFDLKTPKSPAPPRQLTWPIRFDRRLPETSKETLSSTSAATATTRQTISSSCTRNKCLDLPVLTVGVQV